MDNNYRRISDIVTSIDCDIDKVRYILELLDEETCKEYADKFNYVKANEEMNILISILFDYVLKIREQVQTISKQGGSDDHDE